LHGVLDASSARDLGLFLAAVQPLPGDRIERPVVVWRDGARVVVELVVTCNMQGVLRFELGAERSDLSELDEPEVVDARLDELDTLVWVTDAERLARYFNPAWLEFTGTALADNLGWGWMQRVHPDDLVELMTVYERAQAAPRGFERIARLADARGDWWWVRVRATPRLERSRFQGFLGICETVGRERDVDPPVDAGVSELLPPIDRTAETPAAAASRLARLAAALDVTRPAEPLEVTLLRRLASRWLAQHDTLADRHDDVVLAVGEAAANSALHAYPKQPGPVRLTCSLDDKFAVFCIRDWGSWRPPSLDRESRGIFLIEALTDDCAINHLEDGTEVVLRFGLGPR
jgi:PAS domain S-box-containing protein